MRRSATGAVDEYGNPQVQDQTIETVWEIQPLRSEQANELGPIATSTYNAYFLAGEQVYPGDQILDLLDDRTFQVDGEPEDRRNPRTGEFSHVEGLVKRTRGLDQSDAGS